MNKALATLKGMREGLDILKTMEGVLEEKYKSTPEYQEYAANHAVIITAKQQIEDQEAYIRETAEELSRQTGFEERHFGPVLIKEFTKVKILDHNRAVTWAAENAPNCLTLTKDFDKAARNLQLPFTKIEKEYHAQIASDLSKYVVEAEDADNTGITPQIS